MRDELADCRIIGAWRAVEGACVADDYPDGISALMSRYCWDLAESERRERRQPDDAAAIAARARDLEQQATELFESAAERDRQEVERLARLYREPPPNTIRFLSRNGVVLLERWIEDLPPDIFWASVPAAAPLASAAVSGRPCRDDQPCAAHIELAAANMQLGKLERQLQAVTAAAGREVTHCVICIPSHD